VTPSRHTVWFLKPESRDYILDCDLLMLTPLIKNIAIARKLIQEYAVHPMSFDYPIDPDYQQPLLKGVYGSQYDEEIFGSNRNR